MKNILIQNFYIRDGIYLFQCSFCKETLESTQNIRDYTIKTCGSVVKDIDCDCDFVWPINYCWNCGKKFSNFEVLG